ncbi:MAG: DUF262 domain-containing protein [Mycoplasma sp.]
MNRKHKLGEYSINKFLTEYKNLYIPCYQREYAWGTEQVLAYLDDIYKEINQDPSLGIIHVYENEDEKNEIIDGQQRVTTTLLVLLCYSEKSDESDEISKEIKKILFDKNQKFKALEAFSENLKEDYQNVFESGNWPNRNSNLYEAYNLISHLFNGENKKNKYHKQLKCYSELEKFFNSNDDDDSVRTKNVEKFVNSLFYDLKIYIFEYPSSEKAHSSFLKLNSRGIPLSFIDLLKSFLINNIADDEKKERSCLTKKQMVANLVIHFKEIIMQSSNKSSKMTDEKAEKIVLDAFKAYLKSEHEVNVNDERVIYENYRKILANKKNDELYNLFNETIVKYVKMYITFYYKTSSGISLRNLFSKEKGGLGLTDYLPIIISILYNKDNQKFKFNNDEFLKTKELLIICLIKKITLIKTKIETGTRGKFDSNELHFQLVNNACLEDLRNNSGYYDGKIIKEFNKGNIDNNEQFDLFDKINNISDGIKTVKMLFNECSEISEKNKSLETIGKIISYLEDVKEI